MTTVVGDRLRWKGQAWPRPVAIITAMFRIAATSSPKRSKASEWVSSHWSLGRHPLRVLRAYGGR